MDCLITYISISLLLLTSSVNSIPVIVSANKENVDIHINAQRCRHEEIVLGNYMESCVVDKDQCSRHVVDGYFDVSDIIRLHNIAKKGMSHRKSVGGPTILDINTGYIRDSIGLENLFSNPNDIYSSEDFSHYGRIINRLKELVSSTFNISNLYFTSPTFITRLDGRQDWQPQGVHDEYWHAHADMNNTAHYHYSGLLYMSTYGEDFTGGRVVFTSPENYEEHIESDYELIVEPRIGRVVTFTSGPENTHFVERVTSGQRFVLSFWFTCNAERQFEIFLDGKKHTTFSHMIRDKNKKKFNQVKKDL